MVTGSVPGGAGHGRIKFIPFQALAALVSNSNRPLSTEMSLMLFQYRIQDVFLLACQERGTVLATNNNWVILLAR
jgi:hypothetical protein